MKTERVTFRLPKKEEKVLEEYMKANGLTNRSDVIRKAILHKMEVKA